MAFSWLCPPPCPTWVLAKEGSSTWSPHSRRHQGETSQLLSWGRDSSQQGWGLPAPRPCPRLPSEVRGQSSTASVDRAVTVFREAEWTQMDRMDEERASPRPGGAVAAPREEHGMAVVGGAGGFKPLGPAACQHRLQVPTPRPCLQGAPVPQRVHSPLFTFSKNPDLGSLAAHSDLNGEGANYSL